MGEDIPTLQRTAHYLVWVEGKISNGNTFIIAARILQKKKIHVNICVLIQHNQTDNLLKLQMPLYSKIVKSESYT